MGVGHLIGTSRLGADELGTDIYKIDEVGGATPKLVNNVGDVCRNVNTEAILKTADTQL
jgi:hypothetical protein